MLPAVLINQVPMGLAGLIIVAMLAAMKGSLAGMVNVTSAYSSRISTRTLRPRPRNRELIAASWLSTAASWARGSPSA